MLQLFTESLHDRFVRETEEYLAAQINADPPETPHAAEHHDAAPTMADVVCVDGCGVPIPAREWDRTTAA